MADRARELTDARLDVISKRLTSEYRSAQKELTEKFSKYMAKADKGLERLIEAYRGAVASKDAEAIKKAAEALEKAKLNITLNDKRYRSMIDDITDRLADVNKTSLNYVNGQMPYIYRQNYNGAKSAADEVGMDFALMNEDAVARRIREGDIRLPKKKLEVPKDKRWNTKQLNSSVLQGILQGESMDKIAKRILPIVDNNRDAAIRNARTMVTGAENEGRLDGFHKLEEDGAVLKKVWIATADSRTREAHLFLDGQEVDTDKPFVDADGNELMYPGDPSAAPETVYNCRCSMRTHIIGFRRKDGGVEEVKYNHKSGMHQQAIEKERKERGVEIPKEPEKPKKHIDIEKLKRHLSEKDYNEYIAYINNTDWIQAEYERYGEQFIYIKESSGGYYSGNTIHWSEAKSVGMNKYSTLAHECGHGFDADLGRDYKQGNITFDVTYNEIEALSNKLKRWDERPRELPSHSDQFLGALRTDMSNLLAEKKAGNLHLLTATQDLPNARNSTAGVQDALDGFYNMRTKAEGYACVWGHGANYYNRFWRDLEQTDCTKVYREVYKELGYDVSNWDKTKAITRHYEAASEAWANVSSALTCGGEELAAIEKYMPETISAYKKIVESIKKVGGD